MSPTPVSSKDKSGNYDIGMCIRFLRREHPEWKPDQMEAVCLETARKAHGEKREK